MVNSIVVVFFYRLQPITTDLISKMHEKSLALTLFSKLCQCRDSPKLPKTSLIYVKERQTDAGGATITSYIISTKFSFPTLYYCVSNWQCMWKIHICTFLCSNSCLFTKPIFFLSWWNFFAFRSLGSRQIWSMQICALWCVQA